MPGICPTPRSILPLCAALIALSVSGCSHTPTAGARPSADPQPTASDSVPPAVVVAPVAATTGKAAPNPLSIRNQADCPEGMLFIPEGDFSMVAALPGKRDQTPQRQSFHLRAFCIDRTEVPMSKWDSDACGKQDSDCMGDVARRGPAVCIAEDQAECYCERARPGHKARLPTDPEWLYAALGTDGRNFPWGNEPYPAGLHARSPDFCALEGRLPTAQIMCPVDASSRDKGPFGVIGMGTNGWEMNSTCVKLETAPRDPPYCIARGLDHSDEVPPLPQSARLLTPPGVIPIHKDPATTFRCATSERAHP